MPSELSPGEERPSGNLGPPSKQVCGKETIGGNGVP